MRAAIVARRATLAAAAAPARAAEKMGRPPAPCAPRDARNHLRNFGSPPLSRAQGPPVGAARRDGMEGWLEANSVPVNRRKRMRDDVEERALMAERHEAQQRVFRAKHPRLLSRDRLF